MAYGALKIGRSPGWVATGGLLAVIVGALVAVSLRAEAGRGLQPGDWAAIRFTVLQSFLSALTSVTAAVFLARALARRQFAGRRFLVAFLGAPFIFPTIVAVMGLLGVFGRSGMVNTALGALGIAPLDIFGLDGVVLAHFFFNMPLATRLFLQGWADIPAERLRLAEQLGLSARGYWQVLERPMLMRVLPGAFALIFAICLTSFAVALTLGGGPRATTIELAIYQAFRFDFDLGRAAMLSLVQIAIAGLATVIALRIGRTDGFGAGHRPAVNPSGSGSTVARALDGAIIACAALFLLLPFLAVVIRGIPGMPNLPASVWTAAFNSVWVALLCTGLTLALALAIAALAVQSARGWAELAGVLGLTASPLMIGTGLFLIINPVIDPFLMALPVTALVNAITALPFALRIVLPTLRESLRNYSRLAESLGMQGLSLWRLVLLPRLRRPLGFAAGLSAALSMGDLGVIALFSNAERVTLPMAMYGLMASFRMSEAAAVGLILLLMSFFLFWIFDSLGGARDQS